MIIEFCVEREPLIVSTVAEYWKKHNESKTNRFTDDERLLLEAVFAYNQHPNEETIRKIADNLAVSEIKICRWFNYKKCMMKLQAERSSGLQRKLLHTFTRWNTV